MSPWFIGGSFGRGRVIRDSLKLAGKSFSYGWRFVSKFIPTRYCFALYIEEEIEKNSNNIIPLVTK
jgi:hypothetical protein